MVYKQEIERFARKHPSSTFHDLVVETGATTGCGRCKNVAENYFNQSKRKVSGNKQLFIDF
jgi:bacterioferritin-associated ferredoxin